MKFAGLLLATVLLTGCYNETGSGGPAVAGGAGGTGTAHGKWTGGDPAVTSNGEVHSTGRGGEGGSNLSTGSGYPQSKLYDYGEDFNPSNPEGRQPMKDEPKVTNQPITPRQPPNDRPGRP